MGIVVGAIVLLAWVRVHLAVFRVPLWMSCGTPDCLRRRSRPEMVAGGISPVKAVGPVDRQECLSLGGTLERRGPLRIARLRSHIAAWGRAVVGIGAHERLETPIAEEQRAVLQRSVFLWGRQSAIFSDLVI